MTELSFAKSFLTTLNSRSAKISSDHVEDPRSYPAKGAYILPKMPRPMSKRQKLAPGQERSINISLKSIRNPPIDIALKSRSPLTSILDLKTEVSNQASIPLEKIRILFQKKPVGDSKVVKDLVGEDATVDFGIMIMGGAASVNKEDKSAASPAAHGTELLASGEFWGDLKGFLTQRLRDQAGGERVYDVFKQAWEASDAAASQK